MYVSLCLAFQTGEWYQDGKFNTRSDNGSNKNVKHDAHDPHKPRAVIELDKENYFEECEFQKEQWGVIMDALKVSNQNEMTERVLFRQSSGAM